LHGYHGEWRAGGSRKLRRRTDNSSVVAFTKSGERLVGQAAKRQAVTNSKNTVFSVKRFIGRKFPRLRAKEPASPTNLSKPKNGDVHIEVDVKGEKEDLFPGGNFLLHPRKLKADAESKLRRKNHPGRHPPSPLILTNSQRHATKDAGRIAGLEVLRIINEPNRRVARLRPRKEKGRENRRLRFGRRHVRHLRPRNRRRCV